MLSRCGSTDRHADFVPSGPGTRSNFQGTPFWRIEACGPGWRIVEGKVSRKDGMTLAEGK